MLSNCRVLNEKALEEAGCPQILTCSSQREPAFLRKLSALQPRSPYAAGFVRCETKKTA